jgi:hypothetical protein
MGRDPLDDITQIDEWVDLEVLTGLDQRTENRRSVRCRFTAREEPILPALHDRP